MNKLITKEDPFHLHKFCGFLCLVNYIYQYYQYFVHSRYDLNKYTLLPHLLLHATSFVFKVLERRPIESKLNMFIWNELRIHAMLFAYRGCFSILFPNYGFGISLLTMILADTTTYICGTPGISTVRGQQYKVGKRSVWKEMGGAFFSISQFGATIITTGLFQPHPSAILIFSTLPPIQTSAFGMTLIRKNIINKQTWTLVYALELLFTYCIWYKEYGNLNVLYFSLLFYILRRQRISKYVLWMSAYHIDFLLKLFLETNPYSPASSCTWNNMNPSLSIGGLHR